MRTFMQLIIGILLACAIASEASLAWYSSSYGYRSVHGYGYSYGLSSLAARNEYWRYQIPSGTGYVFSPGYYNGPTYFPRFTEVTAGMTYGPYGSYSSRNRVYPYQYVPYWS